MKISTEINSFRRFGGVEQILTLLKESGFTAYDFSMFSGGVADGIMLADDYLEKAKALRAFADKLGLPCNQTHAPFATARKGDEAYNAAMYPKIVRAIEVSGVLGAKVCVVHPCNDYTAEENAVLYKSFENVARKAGVKIGVENMWNWDEKEDHASKAACSHHDDFKKHMELLPDDVFTACLDIGHAEMTGLDTNAVRMIETLDKHLGAIHLHDNNRWGDNHAIPFTYNIDFEAIIQAFEKIGYKGDITMEADRFASKVPVELIPAAARYLAAVAEYFRVRLEK
ncbi:MAG: sugar phosphate isomerase/epimerase [Clostridia bacterium]|nr:sugar phosphate isomerase/epimerase [Clostridia bacterium]